MQLARRLILSMIIISCFRTGTPEKKKCEDIFQSLPFTYDGHSRMLSDAFTSTWTFPEPSVASVQTIACRRQEMRTIPLWRAAFMFIVINMLFVNFPGVFSHELPWTFSGNLTGRFSILEKNDTKISGKCPDLRACLKAAIENMTFYVNNRTRRVWLAIFYLPLTHAVKLQCRRCHILHSYARLLLLQFCGRPLPSDRGSALVSALSVWCDLALPAWQHGSGAVKCHIAVAFRGSGLLRGLMHGGGKQMEQESQLKVKLQCSWIQFRTAVFILMRGLYSYFMLLNIF